MKKILITALNSYIGNKFEEWVKDDNNKYKIDKMSIRDDSWKEQNFSKYDVIFHVAGIAHIKETKSNRNLYFKVNRDLAYEIAKKAKLEGVKQFVFLSTMSVYGLETGIIDENTPLQPKNSYGQSKLEAEKLINEIKDNSFKIAILRPPMVYGKGCKGNYPRLAKLALIMPIFPDIDNKRSMIYIDNLSECIKLIIDNKGSGLFFPQNSEYVNTSKMVKIIAESNGQKMIMTKLFNPVLQMIRISIINKVFGNLTYKKSLSKHYKNYKVYGLNESIKITEEKS